MGATELRRRFVAGTMERRERREHRDQQQHVHSRALALTPPKRARLRRLALDEALSCLSMLVEFCVVMSFGCPSLFVEFSMVLTLEVDISCLALFPTSARLKRLTFDEALSCFSIVMEFSVELLMELSFRPVYPMALSCRARHSFGEAKISCLSLFPTSARLMRLALDVALS